MAISGIIYIATCRTHGKQYVGQTYSKKGYEPERLLSIRRKKHIAAAAKQSGLPFHSAIRKYGEEDFDWQVFCTASSVEELNRLESQAILSHNTLVKNGYNAIIRERGAYSDETRRKMSNAAKRRWQEGESRRRIFDAVKAGRDRYIEKIRESSRLVALKSLRRPEVRAKANASIKHSHNKDGYKAKRSLLSKQAWGSVSPQGREQRMRGCRASAIRKERHAAAVQSLEYKAKMSAQSRQRTQRPFQVLNAATGETVAEYRNIIVAADELRVFASNISACLHGRAKTFGRGRYKALFTGMAYEQEGVRDNPRI